MASRLLLAFAMFLAISAVSGKPGKIRDDDDPNPLHIKLVYYKDYTIRAQIQLGTPGQTLNLMLDTTFADTIVISPKCLTWDNSTCSTNPALNYTRTTFDGSASSTFKNLGINAAKRGDNFQADYTASADAFSIADFQSNIMFGSAYYMPSSNDDSMADGILGLGIAGILGKSIFANLSSTYPSMTNTPSLVSYWLNDFEQPNGKGYLTLGDYDDRNCQNDNLTTITLTSGQNWEFRLNGWKHGNRGETKNLIARVDSTSRYNLVPQATLTAIGTAANATFDSGVGSYFLPCEKTTFLPDFQFTIGTQNYGIKYLEYVDSYMGTDRCEILFQTNSVWEQTRTGPQVVLGHPWQRAYCHMFDVQKLTLQISKANHYQ